MTGNEGDKLSTIVKRTLEYPRMRLLTTAVLAGCILLAGCKEGGGTGAATRGGSSSALKINGSTTGNLPAAEAAEILRAEKGMNIQVDTQGGSSGGISMLADGQVQVGMSSKPVAADDRAKYPKVNFNSIHIGEDAVAMIVSRDVWDGGVRAISKAQLKEIYEGRVSNWKDLGGPDQRIAFFNKEPGRGTWEVFAHWVYGNPKPTGSTATPSRRRRRVSPRWAAMRRRATRSPQPAAR